MRTILDFGVLTKKRKPTKSQVLVIVQIMAIAMAATRIILKMDGTMAEEVNAKN